MITEAHAHNLKPENTSRLSEAFDAARNGQVREIVVNSDSSGTGAILSATWWVVNFDHTLAWPLLMGNEWARAAGIPVGGTGAVRTLDNTMIDSRWATPGFGWKKDAKTFLYTARNGAAQKFTSNHAGDRVTFTYFDGGTVDADVFTVTAGGYTRTVTTDGARGWKKMTLFADVPVGGTVDFIKKSGLYMRIGTVDVWSSAGGLLIHNIGQGGSSAYGDGALNDRWVDDSTTSSLGGPIFADISVTDQPPACVITALGGNDKREGIPDELVIDAIRRRRQKFPDSDFILVAEHQLNDSLVPRAAWIAFVTALYALSDELDVPLIDHDAALGPFQTIKANGWNADSSGHLKPAVLEQIGRSTANLLLANAA